MPLTHVFRLFRGVCPDDVVLWVPVIARAAAEDGAKVITWGIPVPQISHPAFPPPTQQMPPAPLEEMWDDTYLAVLGTQQYDGPACRHPSWSASGDGYGPGDF